MRLLCISILLAAAGSAAVKRIPDVVVYLHHGTQSAFVVGRAQGEAEQMLACVGISVEWRDGAPKNHPTAEVIEAELVDRVAEQLHRGSLAFATLGTGTRIDVLWSRVVSAGPPSAIPSILAHVLAHEITHVLEGVGRHSETGVMKPHWSPDDFLEMRRLAEVR